MIKKILFPIVMIIAIVAGGFGADMLRNKKTNGDAEETSHKPKKKSKSHAKKDDGHDKKDDGHSKKKKKAKKKKGHGEEKDDHASASTAITYMKFKRQFVVPVIKSGKIQSLVLLNLNLELNQDAPDSPYTLEPKLRDAIMRELLVLSHGGAFSDNLTSAATYDKLRAALLEACESVIKDGVENVLILDLSRQDQ